MDGDPVRGPHELALERGCGGVDTLEVLDDWPTAYFVCEISDIPAHFLSFDGDSKWRLGPEIFDDAGALQSAQKAEAARLAQRVEAHSVHAA